MNIYICHFTNIDILKIALCKEMLKPVKIFSVETDEKAFVSGQC